MKKKNKIKESAEWIMAIGFVLGFMVALGAGIWYGFNWLMQTTLGINLLELCSRVGLIGQIALILAPFILIVMVWVGLFGMPCMDMC